MGFETLLDIIREADEEVRDQEDRRPVDCPECGTALQEGRNGSQRCPFDGWRNE
jgi:hypothetical protein